MEQEFIENQQRAKPQKDQDQEESEDTKKIEQLRGSPMMYFRIES